MATSKTTDQSGRAPGGADSVVIGAGAVGLCVALHLQRTGRRVTVIERGEPGRGASGHNAGIISVANCVPTGSPEVLRSLPRMLTDPLSPLAIRWPYLPRLSPWLVRFALASRPARVEAGSIALKSLLDHATSAYEPFISPDGSNGTLENGRHVLAFASDEAFAKAKRSIAVRSRRGVSFTVLDEAGLAALDPLFESRFRHGILVPDAPFTRDPRAFTAELADRFRRGGGTLLRAEATRFDLANGTVRAVETSAGRVRAGEVVVATGAWSRALARHLGAHVPLDTERGYGVILPEPGMTLTVPLISMDHHFALTPAEPGLRLAGTDELAGLAAAPNYARAERLVQAARSVFPDLRTGGAARWMSHRPSLPDGLPVIGRAPRVTNAYLAFGHGHVGLTLAGVTGQVIRELMDGDTPSVDLAPFAPERFFSIRWRRPARRTPARVGSA
jgi:glycine/D-amino acid oxidase-like deaminating enzyme